MAKIAVYHQVWAYTGNVGHAALLCCCTSALVLFLVLLRSGLALGRLSLPVLREVLDGELLRSRFAKFLAATPSILILQKHRRHLLQEPSGCTDPEYRYHTEIAIWLSTEHGATPETVPYEQDVEGDVTLSVTHGRLVEAFLQLCHNAKPLPPLFWLSFAFAGLQTLQAWI
eukprot:s2588_g10.t1